MATPEWKKLEQELQKYFEDRMEVDFLIYHRFMDTHAAGDFLPAQPGDHMVVSNGKTILIETKYSARYTSLSQCFSEMVSDRQIVHHRLWARAGARTLFMFKGKDYHYELWDGAECAWCRVNNRRLSSIGGPIKEFTSLSWKGAMKSAFDSLVIKSRNSFYQEKLL